MAPRRSFKLMCSAKEPSVCLFSSKELTIDTDAKGIVTVSTGSTRATLWSRPEDGFDFITIASDKPKKVNTSRVVLTYKDLRVAELQTSGGREYIITAKRIEDGQKF